MGKGSAERLAAALRQHHTVTIEPDPHAALGRAAEEGFDLRSIADAIPEAEKGKLAIGVEKERPLVQRHKNGRKSLIVGSTADRIVGMELAYGRAYIARLNEWATQPDFVYQHQWQAGDFVIWSNTGALHRVVPYARDSGRMMHRTSIAG